MQPQVPMYVYEPKNRHRQIYLARLFRRPSFNNRLERVLFLAASVSFIAGVIIGAAFF